MSRTADPRIEDRMMRRKSTHPLSGGFSQTSQERGAAPIDERGGINDKSLQGFKSPFTQRGAIYLTCGTHKTKGTGRGKSAFQRVRGAWVASAVTRWEANVSDPQARGRYILDRYTTKLKAGSAEIYENSGLEAEYNGHVGGRRELEYGAKRGRDEKTGWGNGITSMQDTPARNSVFPRLFGIDTKRNNRGWTHRIRDKVRLSADLTFSTPRLSITSHGDYPARATWEPQQKRRTWALVGECGRRRR
ncbi:hypothetical protein DFH07DRAFT_766910 [Mycena maculata]|uniref:Uncharacterized protein n=1 Tax=Mycena maculata TaxID=230809 RepID=A0AAD7K0R7_9AGAR|nr:hypothetical protein DFH07DRAFT_766910 [Mycena maculata]